MKTPFQSAFAVLFALVCASCVQADIVFSNDIDGTNPSLDDPFTSGQTVDAGISVSGIGRSAEISGNAGANRYNARGWQTTSENVIFDPGLDRYFTWTITPQNSEVDFESLEFVSQRSQTSGPTGYAFMSSIDGFDDPQTQLIQSGTNFSNPTPVTIDLSGAQFQDITTPVEFRLYAFGAGGSNGTFSVNSFEFNAAITVVPEPASLGIYLVFVGMTVRRRRSVC